MRDQRTPEEGIGESAKESGDEDRLLARGDLPQAQQARMRPCPCDGQGAEILVEGDEDPSFAMGELEDVLVPESPPNLSYRLHIVPLFAQGTREVWREALVDEDPQDRSRTWRASDGSRDTRRRA